MLIIQYFFNAVSDAVGTAFSVFFFADATFSVLAVCLLCLGKKNERGKYIGRISKIVDGRESYMKIALFISIPLFVFGLIYVGYIDHQNIQTNLDGVNDSSKYYKTRTEYYQKINGQLQQSLNDEMVKNKTISPLEPSKFLDLQNKLEQENSEISYLKSQNDEFQKMISVLMSQKPQQTTTQTIKDNSSGTNQTIGNNNQAPVVQLSNSTFTGNINAKEPPRTITQLQGNAFLKSAKSNDKTKIAIWVVANDREANDYADQLANMFQQAGYEIGEITTTTSNVPLPSFGISIPADLILSGQDAQPEYAQELYNSLLDAKIEVSKQIDPSSGSKPAIIFIQIGNK
jgi:hypothetical protein